MTASQGGFATDSGAPPADYGFLRVAACSPRLSLADPDTNAGHLMEAMRWAGERKAALLVTPEMSLTGYTCSDLFHQPALLDAAMRGLRRLLDAQVHGDVPRDLLCVVGLPVAVRERLYNCAVLIQSGRIVGVVPKTHLPNYTEFYDERYFSSSMEHAGRPEAFLFEECVPFSHNLLFRVPNRAHLLLGIEICEDAWAPIPRSAHLCSAGAKVIVNPSASNELISKADYRRDVIVRGHSATGVCGYVYAGSGPGESSTDAVFGGHCLIAENGSLLGESERFVLDRLVGVCHDIDLGRLATERNRLTTYAGARPSDEMRTVDTNPVQLVDYSTEPLLRTVNPTPFVPPDDNDRSRRCEEIFHIQTTALARRSAHLNHPRFVIGVSGGLDSTLALLVCSRALQRLGRPPGDLIAVTMPGFGTSERTRGNAEALIEALTDRPARVIDIREACRRHFHDIDHPAGPLLDRIAGGEDAALSDAADVTFENVQARERTQVLMDIANMNGGLVIGTGDLSEMALGWSTYNGDHMSMYAVNCGVPKSLVQYVVRWAAEVEFMGDVRRVLLDVLDTPISPELLPAVKDAISQKTESIIGPYVLHDFFLFHFVRGGAPPRKIIVLAKQAFAGRYDEAELHRWLGLFLRRFFANQFKRSCVPDGPKVGTVSLSPRADWRMPSDASAAAWLGDLDRQEK